MDRNKELCLPGWLRTLSLSARRAWIEISITRIKIVTGWSLSARRAWIEMTLTVRNVPIDSVALRKESVDRNFWLCGLLSMRIRSLSARRAWIEIAMQYCH